MTDFIKSAETVVASVAGFLSHHVNDLTAVHTALSELLNVAPIDAQDKVRISDVLSTIQNSAENITNFLNQANVVPDNSGGDVVVKESDLVAAVAYFFNSDAGKAALAAANHPAASTEGNVNG
jgi:hypothetical protein